MVGGFFLSYKFLCFSTNGKMGLSEISFILIKVRYTIDIPILFYKLNKITVSVIDIMST